MPLLTKSQKRTTISALRSSNVRAVNQKYNEPARLQCNEEWVTAGCLRCTVPRCMKFLDTEINCKHFPDFSYERNLNTCPVGAIKWSSDKNMPEIDNSNCIGCGLCAIRCPIGAIYKTENQMQIAEPTSDYIDTLITDESLEKHNLFIQKLVELDWPRRFQEENDLLMEDIYRKISCFTGRSMASNILVRNLLISLDYECAISRTGDTYTRMDAVYSCNSNANARGVIEIELGKDTLDALRSILDDIAVTHCRYDLDKNNNVALVICLSLPNKRQGYYQVVKDIKQVLNLKIQTISLGTLLLLTWNSAKVDFFSKEFYVDFDNTSIRDITESKLNRSIKLSEGMLGIVEPEK